LLYFEESKINWKKATLQFFGNLKYVSFWDERNNKSITGETPLIVRSRIAARSTMVRSNFDLVSGTDRGFRNWNSRSDSTYDLHWL